MNDWTRYIYTLAFFLLFWLLTPVAWAAEPGWCEDDYLCIEDETARQVRDKARGFELLCSQLGELPSLPPALEALCEEPTGASRIWAKAQKTTEAQQAARKAQREANVTKGQLAEARRQRDTERARNDRLAQENARLKGRPSPWSWLGWGFCAGAGAAGGVQLGMADGPTDVVRGGVTLGVGLVGCGVGLLID